MLCTQWHVLKRILYKETELIPRGRHVPQTVSISSCGWWGQIVIPLIGDNYIFDPYPETCKIHRLLESCTFPCNNHRCVWVHSSLMLTNVAYNLNILKIGIESEMENASFYNRYLLLSSLQSDSLTMCRLPRGNKLVNLWLVCRLEMTKNRRIVDSTCGR